MPLTPEQILIADVVSTTGTPITNVRLSLGDKVQAYQLNIVNEWWQLYPVQKVEPEIAEAIVSRIAAYHLAEARRLGVPAWTLQLCPYCKSQSHYLHSLAANAGARK